MLKQILLTILENESELRHHFHINEFHMLSNWVLTIIGYSIWAIPNFYTSALWIVMYHCLLYNSDILLNLEKDMFSLFFDPYPSTRILFQPATVSAIPPSVTTIHRSLLRDVPLTFMADMRVVVSVRTASITPLVSTAMSVLMDTTDLMGDS